MKGLDYVQNVSQENKFTFNGQTEKETKLNLHWHETAFRSYDPQVGRFHQIDPLADLFTGINPYQFGYNNPVMFNDPTGLANEGGKCENCTDDPNAGKIKKKKSSSSSGGTGMAGVVIGSSAVGGGSQMPSGGSSFKNFFDGLGKLANRSVTTIKSSARSLWGSTGRVVGSIAETGGARLMPILLFADLLTLTTNGGKNDASVRNHERFEQEQYENYLSRQAGDSKEERDNYTYFFTVQSNEDTDRLRTTGYPFPTEPNKSALGEGVYAWGTLAAAHLYRQNLISRYGESVIEKTIILAFRIKTNILNSLRQLDIDSLTNPEEWLSKYSKLWGGIPNHGLQYIIRGTGEAMRGAKEHFFHHTIFSFLKFF